jgi:hypothetical protein
MPKPNKGPQPYEYSYRDEYVEEPDTCPSCGGRYFETGPFIQTHGHRLQRFIECLDCHLQFWEVFLLSSAYNFEKQTGDSNGQPNHN